MQPKTTPIERAEKNRHSTGIESKLGSGIATVSVVIVNWNTGNLLGDCLQSMSRVDLTGTELREVVVVDNASSDGSLAGVDGQRLPLIVVKNHANLGFAAACNQGARLGSGQYLLFLNPDTRLFVNSLRVPLEFLSRTENAAVGICGIRLLDDSGHTTRHCARFPRLSHYVSKAFGLDRLLPGPVTCQSMKEWDHESEREVDQVIGAFFLVRRNLFEALGGFDERFFVYFEEVDFSLRAHRAGWKTVYLAGATAYHKGHGSSEKVAARRLFYSLRSRLLYSLKNWPVIKVIGLFAVTLLVEPLTRLCLSMAKGAVGDARGTLAGYGMLVRDLSSIMFRSHRALASEAPRPRKPNAG